MEQDIEAAAGETGAQRRDLARLGDVEGLDFDTARMSVRQIVQPGSDTFLHGADDVPAFRQKFGGHPQAKAA